MKRVDDLLKYLESYSDIAVVNKAKIHQELLLIKKEVAAINNTHSCTELKTFDIHECINEVTKSANKLSPWIVDARKDRSFRYIIKKAIDKMLYSN